MPSRPDLRDLASNVKEAFADADRETLLEVLTFVLKEYVVEGPPPMLIHQAETLSDLQGTSFAQLITALQTRFDHPELAMFVVDGEQVGVRVGGTVQPLVGARQPLTAEPGRPAAGVRVVETTVARPPSPSGFVDTRPAAPAGASGSSAPPPTRGLSIRGRPGEPAASGAAQPAPQGSAPTPPTPSTPAAAPSAAPAPSDKPEGSSDEATARFSLLELD